MIYCEPTVRAFSWLASLMAPIGRFLPSFSASRIHILLLGYPRYLNIRIPPLSAYDLDSKYTAHTTVSCRNIVYPVFFALQTYNFIDKSLNHGARRLIPIPVTDVPRASLFDAGRDRGASRNTRDRVSLIHARDELDALDFDLNSLDHHVFQQLAVAFSRVLTTSL